MTKRDSDNSNAGGVGRKQKPLMYGDHPRPRTRRQLLSQGFVAFSALSLMPKSLPFGLGRALAQQQGCGGGGNAVALPFMVFDMAGGAALPANFLVGNQGGPMDLLPQYDKLGWDPRLAGALNNEMGLPMASGVSGLLQGILETTDAATRQRLRLGSVCHNGQDDTRSNQLNAMTLVSAAGAEGLFVSKGLGSRNSAGGGNSDVAFDDPQFSPVFVSSVNDVKSAVNFGGETLGELSDEQLREIATGSLSVTQNQLAKYAGLPDGDMLGRIARCAYEKNLSLVESLDGIDPRESQQAAAVYQIDGNSAAGSEDVVAATIALNALQGQSGPGVWTVGGCDYHDGTATTGDAKDLEMGRQIGRAVALASALNRPLFFQLITDGGCDNRQGSRIWTSDSGIRSMSVMGYFDPQQTPRYIMDGNDPIMQVGHYTNGQAVSTGTLVGSSPQKAAYAVFANYLNVLGRLGEFENYVPGVFSTEELESLLVFDRGTDA